MCQGMPTTVLVTISLCNVLCVRACLPLYLLLLVFVMSYVSGHAYHCTCYYVSLCNVLCVRACLPLYLLLFVFVMSFVSGHAYHKLCRLLVMLPFPMLSKTNQLLLITLLIIVGIEINVMKLIFTKNAVLHGARRLLFFQHETLW